MPESRAPRLRTRDVVVITGASTGIGRATAHEFAKKGARLVLAARNLDKLNDVAQECEALGAEAFAISVDVADNKAVESLVDKTLAKWQRIDVWINNAGVGAIGSFTDTPIEEHRRVIETNLMGYIHGAHAALKVFKKQGSGVLINNASISSRLAAPYIATYTASKFAIRGLTHSIRQDLALEGFNHIHACQINPGVIDTPAFQHAANYSGLPLKLRVPMAKPEQVAKAILGLVERPRREIFVGPLTWLGTLGYTLFPAFTSATLVWMMKRYYFAQPHNKPAKEGNIHSPVNDRTQVKGGWKSGAVTQS